MIILDVSKHSTLGKSSLQKNYNSWRDFHVKVRFLMNNKYKKKLRIKVFNQ